MIRYWLMLFIKVYRTEKTTDVATVSCFSSKCIEQRNTTDVAISSHCLYVAGMVSVLDEAFGNITAALERQGLMDNTLLIFTSDVSTSIHCDRLTM